MVTILKISIFVSWDKGFKICIRLYFATREKHQKNLLEMKKYIFILLIFLMSNQFTVAQDKQLDSFIIKAKGESDDNLKLEIYRHIYTNQVKKDIHISLNFAKKTSVLANQIKNKKAECLALNHIGRVYIKQGKKDSAAIVLQKALTVANSIQYLYGIAENCYFFSRVHFLSDNYDFSIEKAQRGLNIFIQLDSFEHVANSYNAIGNAYKDKGTDEKDEIKKHEYYNKSLENYKKGLEYTEEISRKSSILANTAGVYIRQKEYKLALENANKSIEFAEQLNNNYALSFPYLIKAKTLNLLKQHNEAIKYLKKSKQYRLNDKSFALWVTNNLKIAYRDLGDFEEALKYSEEYIELKDSLFVLDKQKIINNIEIKYHTKEKELLNKQLNLQKQHDEKLIKLQKSLLFGSITVILLMILLMIFLLILLIFFFIKKKKAEKKIVIQKIEIEEKNKRLQKRTKEQYILNEKLYAKNIEVDKQNSELNQQKEEIQTQAELLKFTNEKLIKLGEFKEIMTGMIVHDLKNPLSNIINIRQTEPETEQTKIVQYSAYKMLNLVMNILDVRKFGEAKINLKKSEFNLMDILLNALNQLKYLSNQKNIKITHFQNVEIKLSADKELIERVIVNILSNSLKYTEPNGKIDFYVEELHQNNIKIIIKDNGVGIRKENIKNVFDKYEQAGKRKWNSTGLGLTFCKIVVEEHKGKIGIESEKDKGTKVWFSLPDTKIVKKKYRTTVSENKIIIEQKIILKKYLPLLKKTDIFQASELRKILKSIKKDGLENEKWVEYFNFAIINCNEKKYNELITVLEQAK